LRHPSLRHPSIRPAADRTDVPGMLQYFGCVPDDHHSLKWKSRATAAHRHHLLLFAPAISASLL
jgi:hypothetical protein